MRKYLKQASEAKAHIIEVSECSVYRVGIHELIYLKNDCISNIDEAAIVWIGKRIFRLDEEAFTHGSSSVMTKDITDVGICLDFYVENLIEIW